MGENMKLSEYSDDDLIEEIQHRALIICTNNEHIELRRAAQDLLIALENWQGGKP